MPSCIALNDDVECNEDELRAIPLFKIQLITITLHPSQNLRFKDIIGEFK